MKYIKRFESYNLESPILEFLNVNQKSQFLRNLTFADLANKFKKTPEYIAEFENYLKLATENGRGFKPSQYMSPEEEYKFHLEENYPEYLGDDEGSAHHGIDI